MLKYASWWCVYSEAEAVKASLRPARPARVTQRNYVLKHKTKENKELNINKNPMYILSGDHKNKAESR